MLLLLMHLLSCTSQTGTVRTCVCVCVCWSLCVSYSLCFQKPPPPPPPSSQKTCPVPSNIHQKVHMLFFLHACPCPRPFILPDPQLTNTQTVSDVKQWTRRAFRPLALTVEGIECGRLRGACKFKQTIRKGGGGGRIVCFVEGERERGMLTDETGEEGGEEASEFTLCIYESNVSTFFFFFAVANLCLWHGTSSSVSR